MSASAMIFNYFWFSGSPQHKRTYGIRPVSFKVGNHKKNMKLKKSRWVNYTFINYSNIYIFSPKNSRRLGFLCIQVKN